MFEQLFGYIMRLLTALRIRQLRAPHLVAAIFAISWLGMAVAPCQAMPHPQHQGTSDHGSMPVAGCGHCPSTPSHLDSGCAMVSAPACSSMGMAIPGPRDTQIPQPAAGPPSAFPVFDAFIPDVRPVRDIHARHLPVPRVSIQQRYCTYLK
jgi:hypothetical protein